MGEAPALTTDLNVTCNELSLETVNLTSTTGSGSSAEEIGNF